MWCPRRQLRLRADCACTAVPHSLATDLMPVDSRQKYYVAVTAQGEQKKPASAQPGSVANSGDVTLTAWQHSIHFPHHSLFLTPLCVSTSIKHFSFKAVEMLCAQIAAAILHTGWGIWGLAFYSSLLLTISHLSWSSLLYQCILQESNTNAYTKHMES